MEDFKYKLNYLNAQNGKLKNHGQLFDLIDRYGRFAVVHLNCSDNTVVYSGRFEEYFSRKVRNRKDLLALVDIFDEKEQSFLLDFLNSSQLGLDEFIEFTLKVDGEKKWFHFICVYVADYHGITDKLLFIDDCTAHMLRKIETQEKLYFDSLTGLYNRNYFIRLLIDMCNKAQAENEIVSIMMIDIDDFKKVNDGMGIIAGDDLVRQFGAFLSHYIDSRVLVSRFNNDVFCLAIYAPNEKVNAMSIYNEILKKNEREYLLTTGNSVHMSVTVGVAEFPEASNNPLELVNFAEVIMIKAKNNGKRTIKFFDTESLNRFMRDIEVESLLKSALFNNELTLYYQPQYNSDSKTLRGFEVLCRLFTEEGQVSPGEFIPIAEKSGLIVPIGSWIFEHAVSQYSEWNRTYGIDYTMSVNISALQFEEKDFVRFVIETVEQYGVNPKFIELEITETCFISEIDKILEKIDVLREYGFRISIDDFGTGYSSFSYINKLHIDTVKIDKSFIDSLAEDRSTRIIVKSMNDMIHDLGFEVVAEGVETRDQYDLLLWMKCDIIQGFLFGRPVSASTMEELIKEFN